MSDFPVDAFAGICLSEFKNPGKKTVTADNLSITEKESIRAVAEKSNFQSREPIKLKGKKVIPKTFSLFEEDCEIINSTIRAYLASPDVTRFQPSGSDVVRAALHHFVKQPLQDQARQIQEYRGRGYK